MGVWVLWAATAGMACPKVFSFVGMQAVGPLLGVVMFGMGMSLKAGDLKVVFTRPKDVLTGCAAQFVIMPGLAWLIAKILSLPADLAVGVVLVGCCPGGTASNVITYLAGGDLALSVGMTTVSTIAAPLLTPALTLLLAGEYVDVDATGMLLSIMWVVIVPIIAGLLTQKFLPRLTSLIRDLMPGFSSAVIALIVGIIVSRNSESLWAAGHIVLIAVILHNALGLLLGFSIGKLTGLTLSKCAAMSIEVGMQNSGLASSLAVSHFAAQPMAAVPGAVFSVWHNIAGAVAASIFRRLRSKSDAGRVSHPHNDD